MAHYVIGDVQGCLAVLLQLLGVIGFEPGRDTVWFAGDLVNRGPQSLETLRFIKSHDGCMRTVLGNHDLYLLYMAEQKHRSYKKKDTIAPVLAAADAPSLIGWLRRQPFYLDGEGSLLVHAGVFPDWTADMIKKNGDELAAWLGGNDYRQLLAHMYGDLPDLMSPGLALFDRLRFNLNVFTRMRVLHKADNRLNFKFKQPLNQLPGDLIPWFEGNKQHWLPTRIFFGHWSALGFHQSEHVTCLDTGAVWGGSLTAYNLHSGEIISVRNKAAAAGLF